MEDVFVSDEALLGAEGDGWKLVNSELALERSGPERYLSSYALFVELLRVVGPEPDGPMAALIGRIAAQIWTLRLMSLSVAGALTRGQEASTQAVIVKDLGNSFEQDLPRWVQATIDAGVALEDDDDFAAVLAYLLQASPSFSLRGGTREILRGLIARELVRRPINFDTFNNHRHSREGGNPVPQIQRRLVRGRKLDARLRGHDVSLFTCRTTRTPMSDLREMLRDTTRRLLGDAWTQGVRQFDKTLWARVAEMGLPALLVPEHAGGADGQWQDAQVVMEAMGEFAMPLPLSETLIGVRALAAAGSPIPETPVGLAVRSNGQLAGASGMWRFTGTLLGVPWGADVTTIVATVADGRDVRIIAVERTAASKALAGANLAGEPRMRLSFDDAPVRLIGDGEATGEDLFDRAALLRIGQIAGALGAILTRSIDYARSRRQFGKPIGQFQSVQHALALMAEETAAVKAACSGAFAAADRGDPAFEIAAAKLRANEAIGVCTALSHQVHGAIGFTHEFELRQFTQRLMSWRTESGNDRYWAERLGRAVARRGSSRFWADLTGRSDATYGPTAP